MEDRKGLSFIWVLFVLLEGWLIFHEGNTLLKRSNLLQVMKEKTGLKHGRIVENKCRLGSLLKGVI